jgi:hypothetical protein
MHGETPPLSYGGALRFAQGPAARLHARGLRIKSLAVIYPIIAAGHLQVCKLGH